MQPSCLTAVLPELQPSPESRSMAVVDAVPPGPCGALRVQGALRAEVTQSPVSTAPLSMFRLPLFSTTALHATCIAVTLMFTHQARPLAPSVVELTLQPEPAAVEPPADVPAVAVTEPEATPSEKPDAPTPEVAQVSPPPPPVVEPSLDPTQPIVTPGGNPPEASAPNSSVAILPTPPPLPPPPRPANHRARATAAHSSSKTPRVETSTDAPQPTTTLPAPAAGNRLSNSPSAAQRASLAAHAADQEAVLEARVRDAVQAAVHYPAAARMMGLTGRARVRLDYQNGVVDDPSLAQSSGAPMLDRAAISAAQAANYPPAPPDLAGRLLRFLVWVEFRSA